jgi:chaperonin GroES
MKPIRQRVVFQEVGNQEQVTDSGLFVPTAEVPDSIGKVVAVGEDVRCVKVGDTILYNKHTAVGFRHKGVDYRVINEDGIMVVLND